MYVNFGGIQYSKQLTLQLVTNLQILAKNLKKPGVSAINLETLSDFFFLNNNPADTRCRDDVAM